MEVDPQIRDKFLKSQSARIPSDRRTLREIERERNKATENYLLDCLIPKIPVISESDGFPSSTALLASRLGERDNIATPPMRNIWSFIGGETFYNEDRSFIQRNDFQILTGLNIDAFIRRFPILSREYIILEEFHNTEEGILLERLRQMLITRPIIFNDLIRVIETYKDAYQGRYTINEMAVRHLNYLYLSSPTSTAPQRIEGLERFFKRLMYQDPDGEVVYCSEPKAKMIGHEMKYGKVQRDLVAYYEKHMCSPSLDVRSKYVDK